MLNVSRPTSLFFSRPTINIPARFFFFFYPQSPYFRLHNGLRSHFQCHTPPPFNTPTLVPSRWERFFESNTSLRGAPPSHLPAAPYETTLHFSPAQRAIAFLGFVPHPSPPLFIISSPLLFSRFSSTWSLSRLFRIPLPPSKWTRGTLTLWMAFYFLNPFACVFIASSPEVIL